VYTKPADLFPSQIGKYIIYRLDSTSIANFGQDEIVTSYQAKDVVEGTSTDLLGRPCLRVVRYLRDVNSNNDQDWVTNIVYDVTPGDNYVEVYENNLRFLKIQGPVKEGRSWIGNGFLPEYPFPKYDFTAALSMKSWEYVCENVDATEDINGTTYDSTVTITQINDSTNFPVENPFKTGQKLRWIEKYAKNIGLIYKEAIVMEYQPQTTTEDAYTTGFGLKLTIISHN
jgi:hypothetical protein